MGPGQLAVSPHGQDHRRGARDDIARPCASSGFQETRCIASAKSTHSRRLSLLSSHSESRLATSSSKKWYVEAGAGTVVTKRVIVPRTPAEVGKCSGTRWECTSGWGRTGRWAKDSTFFRGLSQGSGLKPNVRSLPTTFRQDPKIRTFSTGNDENLASCSGNGDGAAHDPWR